MPIIPEEIVKILLAILVGGLIGAEREFRHRAAGFRTIIFICLGSTLFTMFSLRLGGEASPVRIAAHMVTGVGFLCAGVEFLDQMPNRDNHFRKGTETITPSIVSC